jgi:hypothetical protein
LLRGSLLMVTVGKTACLHPSGINCRSRFIGILLVQLVEIHPATLR